MVALPRRGDGERGRRTPGSMTASRRVAVLKGGSSLERAVSLRSGAQVEDALQGLGHEVSGIDVGSDLVERLIELRPDAVFIALHGPQGEDGTVQSLMEALGLPYTGSPPAGLRARHRQGARQAPDARGRDPDARVPIAAPEPRSATWARAPRCPSIERAARLPDGRQAGPRRLRARRQVRQLELRAARRDGRARSPTTARCCSSATCSGRDLAVSVLGAGRRGPGDAPAGAADRRGGAARRGLLRLRVALRDRHDDLRLPGRAARRDHRPGPASSRSRSTSCSAATASRAST